jgi:nucleoside-diphosphate-sugar epimerase
MVRRGTVSGDRVTAVARFTDEDAEKKLIDSGVETIRCNLLDRDSVRALPDAPNVIYMAGQKFGTSDDPSRTWAMNTIAPALAAEKYAESRIVAFSTGCVYPFVSVESGGSLESEPLEPLGEYANSCVARERIFEYYSRHNRTPVTLLRLNYAIDLLYGVLTDVATKVACGQPIDLTTGFVNVIWQGDANAIAIRCLDIAESPPRALNVTGPETVSIRWLATEFGERFGRQPVFTGSEGDTALLNDAGESIRLFGEPSVTLDMMIDWTANWIKRGGRLLNKPTHYEARDGRF